MRADDEKYKGYKIIPGAGSTFAVFDGGTAIKTKLSSVDQAKKWIDEQAKGDAAGKERKVSKAEYDQHTVGDVFKNPGKMGAPGASTVIAKRERKGEYFLVIDADVRSDSITVADTVSAFDALAEKVRGMTADAATLTAAADANYKEKPRSSGNPSGSWWVQVPCKVYNKLRIGGTFDSNGRSVRVLRLPVNQPADDREVICEVLVELTARGDATQKPYIGKTGSTWELLNSTGKVIKTASSMEALQDDLKRELAKYDARGDAKIGERVSDPAGLARRYARDGRSLEELAKEFKNDAEGYKIAERAFREADCKTLKLA